MHRSLLIVGPDIKNRGVGGVTIHVQRLRDYLDLEGLDYAFADYKSNNLWGLLRLISKYKVVHYHVSNPVLLYFLVVCGRIMGKTVIVTLHGDYGRFGRIQNWMTKRVIQLSSVPIVINEKSYAICKNINKNTMLIPAFIPPQNEELLQKEAMDLLDKLHSEGRKIVSTNASNISVDKYGNEIYGIDFLVRFFKNSNRMVLVVSDPSGSYKKRYEELKSNSIFFIDYPHPYFQVLKHVDFFVRNTSTDGDALSVKEALFLGVPALCTDVVDRPKGVRLYKYCDESSFESCLNECVGENVCVENGAEKVVRIYKSVIGVENGFDQKCC